MNTSSEYYVRIGESVFGCQKISDGLIQCAFAMENGTFL